MSSLEKKTDDANVAALAGRPSRGKNMSMDESLALISAWIEVTCDPISGTDQSSAQFWSRIVQRFTDKRDENAVPRSLNTLQCHWKSLSKSISKFAGILNRLMNDLPSGWNEKMVVDEALHRYNDEMQASFKYMAGYNLLKTCPKFMLVKKTNETGTDVVGAAVENSADKSFVSPPRPTGSKKAKKQKLETPDPDERRKQLYDAASKIAMVADEKKNIAEDKFAMKLFAMDPESDEAKEFFKLKRLEYLQKMKSRITL